MVPPAQGWICASLIVLCVAELFVMPGWNKWERCKQISLAGSHSCKDVHSICHTNHPPDMPLLTPFVKHIVFSPCCHALLTTCTHTLSTSRLTTVMLRRRTLMSLPFFCSSKCCAIHLWLACYVNVALLQKHGDSICVVIIVQQLQHFSTTTAPTQLLKTLSCRASQGHSKMTIRICLAFRGSQVAVAGW